MILTKLTPNTRYEYETGFFWSALEPDQINLTAADGIGLRPIRVRCVGSTALVVNEYDTHYAHPISMYANLRPPIGFIGTTGGMLILFLSMHFSNSSLEIGALAVALTSSIFALIGFSALEGLKIRLYGRLLGSLSDVHALYREADSKRDEPTREVLGRIETRPSTA